MMIIWLCPDQFFPLPNNNFAPKYKIIGRDHFRERGTCWFFQSRFDHCHAVVRCCRGRGEDGCVGLVPVQDVGQTQIDPGRTAPLDGANRHNLHVHQQHPDRCHYDPHRPALVAELPYPHPAITDPSVVRDHPRRHVFSDRYQYKSCYCWSSRGTVWY
jgi:hypothetical protein